MNAESRGLGNGMGRIGGGNQELARHAAHARAGGAVLAAFNDHRARAFALGCTVRDQARCAGTDYCNVNFQSLHVRRAVVALASSAFCWMAE